MTKLTETETRQLSALLQSVPATHICAEGETAIKAFSSLSYALLSHRPVPKSILFACVKFVPMGAIKGKAQINLMVKLLRIEKEARAKGLSSWEASGKAWYL